MTSTRPAAVVVLAAGGGTRMKSATPKVLHRIAGRSLLAHALYAARDVGAEHLVVVVRHDEDAVAAHTRQLHPAAAVVEQDDVPGTGRALWCALQALGEIDGEILVTMGDVPLLTAETLRALHEAHLSEGNAATVVTATLPEPSGYGRIIRADDGSVTANVEERDATPKQRAISEVNTGVYAFSAGAVRDALPRVGTDNAQDEIYLTDVLALLHDGGSRVGAFAIADTWQVEGVNDRVQLARLGAELNRRIVERWMREGVTVVDPATTWIDTDVSLGRDVTIHPNTQLRGATTIADDVVLGPDTTVVDTEIGTGASVARTDATLALIGPGAKVGPYAYLRPGTRLGSGGKIGTFVETKNATIGDGAKVPHLSYVGDAEIGEGTNIGAGTIFANYDGQAKHATKVGAHCRTGSHNVFVAPVEVGDGAATGAGTVVRRDVPPGALAVSTGAQRHIDDWVRRKRPGSAGDRAAADAQRRSGEESS